MRSSSSLLRNFWALLGDQRRFLFIALGTLTISVFLSLILPAGTKVLVDYVLGDLAIPPSWLKLGLPTNRWYLLIWGIAGVLVVSLTASLIRILSAWLTRRSVKRVQISVRKRVFEHAIRLPLYRVYELKSGGAASLLRQDAGSVGELVFAMLYNPWRAALQLVGSLAVLAWVEWRLMFGAILVLPIVYFTHQSWIRRIRPRHRDIRKQRRQLDALAAEAFGGIRVVRAFSRQRSEVLRIMRGNHFLGRQELRVWWSTQTIELVWAIVIPMATAALLLYGGRQVLEEHLTIGDLMMFLVYMLMLLNPLAILAQSAASFQNGLSGLDRVLDLLEEPRETTVTDDARIVRKERTAGRVTFENVSFRYPGADHLALHNISLDVEAATTVALVGPSGAGKTTLCNLVARFYNPASGRILLDEVDLRDLEVESYRRLLGVVEQDVFLFDGTIAENIGYANRDADLDDIRSAAEIANAHEFIHHLTEGYDTRIGERGVKLSGGQRQRLAIARAVLADPRILILDEATSNLDTHSERLIQQSLETVTADRTTFVIAHRLSTIVHADRIVLLKNGSIQEIGTHSQLMAVNGQYRQMTEIQSNLYSDLAEYDDG